MSFHQRSNQGTHEIIERRSGVRDERAFDQAGNLRDMPIMQRCENDAFVRKVLVDRTNADTSDFGDAVRRDALDAVALQDLHDRVEHCFHGRPGAALLWLPSNLILFRTFLYIPHIKYEQSSNFDIIV